MNGRGCEDYRRDEKSRCFVIRDIYAGLAKLENRRLRSNFPRDLKEH